MLSVPTRKRTPLPDLPIEKEREILAAVKKSKPYFDDYILTPEWGCYEVYGSRMDDYGKVYDHQLLMVLEEMDLKFNVAGVTTGRYDASKPNLTALPKEETR